MESCAEFIQGAQNKTRIVDMINFDFKLEDKECMRFVRVQAENTAEALSKAIKESEILNPLNIFQRREGGEFEILDIKAS